MTHSPEEISTKYYRYDKIAEKLLGLDSIDEEQIKKYRNQGYLAIEDVLTPEEVTNAIEALMDRINLGPKSATLTLNSGKVNWDELKTNEEREFAVKKVSNFVDRDERLKKLAYHPSLLAKIEQILGEKPRLAQAIALLKPPGDGEHPWHQDMGVGLAYDKPLLGVWVALDPAELDNGCMHVIPRSHAEGAMPHYMVRSLQICDSDIPLEQDVCVPLKPGGILLFNGLIIHGTACNLSNKRRRALQFHYVGETAEKLKPGEFKRMFTNEITGAEC